MLVYTPPDKCVPISSPRIWPAHLEHASAPHPPLSTGKVLAENFASWRPYAAFKVQLAGERMFFPAGDVQPWNRDYDKARQIFTSKILMSGVIAQHSVLYADSKKQVGWKREGVGRRGWDERQEDEVHTVASTGD